MNKAVKCFIVEGADRDYRFISEMLGLYFKGRYECKTIRLPAEQNIYMLYNKLEKDNFETDLIELLREENEEIDKALQGIDRQCIDEVFLFFDFDLHENNLPSDKKPLDVLDEMVSFFNNETENGKLYISYPMVEALYDYKEKNCDPHTLCMYPISELDIYKRKAGENNHLASIHFTRDEIWREIIRIFCVRLQCLFDLELLDFSFFKKSISTCDIFSVQKKLVTEKKCVFVLSAFPEFLLDYFKKSFWNSHVALGKKKYDYCPKASTGVG